MSAVDKCREALAAMDRLLALANDLTSTDAEKVAAATLAIELGLAVRDVSHAHQLAALELKIEGLKR
jgi:hypothetical protein